MYLPQIWKDGFRKKQFSLFNSKIRVDFCGISIISILMSGLPEIGNPVCKDRSLSPRSG